MLLPDRAPAAGWLRRARGREAPRRCIARAQRDADETPPVALPLFPLPSVLHPAQAGVLRVYEPRYLALFRDQLAAAAGAAAGAAAPPSAAALASAHSQLRFGHVLAPQAAPPALLDGLAGGSGPVGGLPGVGVYARVTKAEQLDDGTLLVHYEGVRRFKLLAVDKEREPYLLAAVQWYEDNLLDLPPADRASVDDLEREVMGLLSEVQRLSLRLGLPLPQSEAEAAASRQPGGGGAALPAAVRRYGPPPRASKGQSTAEYLRAAGVPAGEAIAMWQRHGSVYGAKSARKDAAADPYQALAEAVAKERRQELFSFAAANCLELGLVERLALLLSQDTAGRLAYVAAAIRPYLSNLAAQSAVKGALSGSGGSSSSN